MPWKYYLQSTNISQSDFPTHCLLYFPDNQSHMFWYLFFTLPFDREYYFPKNRNLKYCIIHLMNRNTDWHELLNIIVYVISCTFIELTDTIYQVNSTEFGKLISLIHIKTVILGMFEPYDWLVLYCSEIRFRYYCNSALRGLEIFRVIQNSDAMERHSFCQSQITEIVREGNS